MSRFNVTNLKVYKFITTNPGVTNKDIQVALGVPRKSVYNALVNLLKENRVIQKPSFKDTRQRLYFPNGE